MFGGKKNSQGTPDDYIEYKVDSTVLSANSQFEGKIKSSGVLRVDGSIVGEVDTKGHVIVGEGGSIKESIKASRVTISGVVEGTVLCNGTLEMTQSGILNADIEVADICIEEGAVFNGKCTTKRNRL